jgi:hypothetical protein
MSERMRGPGEPALRLYPDKTMYRCPHEGCGTWNHECLVGVILDKIYKKLVEESGPAANGTKPTVLSSVEDAVTKNPVSRGKMRKP